MPSRWDHLYELKPVSLTEHLLEEVAKLVASELERWPPQIDEWSSPEEQARYARVFEPGAPRPGEQVYAAAFELARWDLGREFERIDEWMRNERWRDFAAPGLEHDAMLLLSRILVEKMLGLAEATESRIKRPQLIACLERAERKLLRAPLVLA